MKILKFLHKIHSLFFYKLVRFVFRLDKVFMENPDMEWVMNKALYAISVIQAIWLLISLFMVEIVIKKVIFNFDHQLAYSIILFIVISAFNYFTLIYKKRWFKYDEEFAAYSKTKNRIINIAILLFYILSFTSFFVSVNI
ncbi:hypothetical protein [Dysgonomonas sp. GY617]|uniref:hypothetical protein n=1 Tax=Dysgonomonas sp. GY617 TaxID=2780420 RepID=UPI00188383DF|nr:hypothetical protein [Dysgonomonas sp. GY617]MBF0578085.1 hypothetical protein [Dysgonomonas sp. GY617]